MAYLQDKLNKRILMVFMVIVISIVWLSIIANGQIQTYSDTVSNEANGQTFTMDCSNENGTIDVLNATYGPNCGVKTNNALNNVKNQCDKIRGCKYIYRYQTQRENTIHDNIKIETNYKNNILKKRLDSIHTFIFHSVLNRNTNIECQQQQEQKADKEQNIWKSRPKTILQCNMKQVQWIMNQDIFDKLKTKDSQKLTPYKSEILKCIQNTNCDGSQLKQLKRKGFINKIAEYVQNNKLKASLGALYNMVMNYDVSNVYEDKQITIVSPIVSNNKFETKPILKAESNAYYSFGMQYRYTKNLQQHPFYVRPRHKTLKEELVAYFTRIQNKQNDTKNLLQSQLQTIESMDKCLHPIVIPFAHLAVLDDMLL
eukprot:488776_1